MSESRGEVVHILIKIRTLLKINVFNVMREIINALVKLSTKRESNDTGR